MHPSCSPTPAATPMEFEGTLRVTLWVGGVGGGVLLHSEMPQGSLGLGRAVEIPTDSGMLTTCRPSGASHPRVTPASANEVVWKFRSLAFSTFSPKTFSTFSPKTFSTFSPKTLATF